MQRNCVENFLNQNFHTWIEHSKLMSNRYALLWMPSHGHWFYSLMWWNALQRGHVWHVLYIWKCFRQPTFTLLWNLQPLLIGNILTTLLPHTRNYATWGLLHQILRGIVFPKILSQAFGADCSVIGLDRNFPSCSNQLYVKLIKLTLKHLCCLE